MIILAGTTSKLQVVGDTGADLHIQATYVDVTLATGANFAIGERNTIALVAIVTSTKVA